MATIRRRVSRKDGAVSYHVQIRMKGKPQQTASFLRLVDAKRWAAQTETAIREGRHFLTTEARKHSVAELIDRYAVDVIPDKGRYGQQQLVSLQFWKEQLGAYLLIDLTPARIVECRDKLKRSTTVRKKRMKPATVNRYLAAISHVFTVAVKEWGWLEDNPCLKVSRLKEPAGRVRCLSPDERTRLLEVCKAHENPALYPIVVIGLCTGLRKSNVTDLAWSQVDFENRRLIFSDPEAIKNRERKGVPLATPALEALREHGKVRRMGTAYVFPSDRKPNQPIDIRKAWESAIKRAGIEDFHFHDLRHTTASYLAMSGASNREIAEVLGHKTLQMVKRYSHLSEPHTAEVVERMADKFMR